MQAGREAVAEITLPGQSRDYAELADLCRDSPEYARLMALVDGRAIDLIVVRHLDCLARTVSLYTQVSPACLTWRRSEP